MCVRDAEPSVRRSFMHELPELWELEDTWHCRAAYTEIHGRVAPRCAGTFRQLLLSCSAHVAPLLPTCGRDLKQCTLEGCPC